MDFGIKGKRALVLGGGRGIGFGIAQALAQEGVELALLSRDEASLRSASQKISAGTGVKSFYASADLNQWPNVEAAALRLKADLGGIDILVNNSGGPAASGVNGVSQEIWRTQFNAMVLSIISLTDLVLPGMRERRWGRILTIGSSTVIQPISSLGVSNTLRSSLVGWSKSLAGEVAADGITVNMLLPGRIATDRTRSLDQASADKAGIEFDAMRTQQAKKIPAGRYGTIEEFGAVVAFIASNQAAYVTGSMIRIDGGAISSV